MDIYFRQTFSTLSPGQTIKLGQSIGLGLIPGMAIMLTGDLGSGKTTLVKGIAVALEVANAEYVNSPTYNLIHQYSGRFNLYHVDLYRINKHADLDEIELEEIFDSDGITVVEWPDKIRSENLPANRLDVRFDIDGDYERSINITSYCSSFNLCSNGSQKTL